MGILRPKLNKDQLKVVVNDRLKEMTDWSKAAQNVAKVAKQLGLTMAQTATAINKAAINARAHVKRLRTVERVVTHSRLDQWMDDTDTREEMVGS